MNVEELTSLTFDDMLKELKSARPKKDFTLYRKQYNVEEHDIYDLVKRPMRLIKDENGILRSVDVTRLSIPFQEIITKRAAAFLVGDGIKIRSEAETEGEEKMLEMILRVWMENKLDYKTREIARLWMSETEVAECWYFKNSSDMWKNIKLPENAGMFSIKMSIWSTSKGDTLYPYFDENGDMIAFGRGYRVKKKEYLDIYTNEYIYKGKKDGDKWIVTVTKNIINKIPVIYYTREKPEWANVQPLIDRFETMISNFSDQNDYFASPIILLKGIVEGFAKKGDSGKMLQLGEGAEANYLTWDQAPEAIRLEREVLQELIFSMTQTPDISFMQLRGLGNVSGVALKLMFLDAKLKCMEYEEVFGQGIQRRINLLKAMSAYVNVSVEDVLSMDIYPEFQFYLPTNDQELLSTLMTGTGSKQILSQKTAVENNPFVKNPKKELEDIKSDEAGDFGNIMNEF